MMAAKSQTEQGFDWMRTGPYWEQWTALLNAWRENLGSQGGTPNAGAYQELFTKAGKGFLDMMQVFQQAMGQDKSAPEAATEWAQNMQAVFTHAFQVNTQPIDMGQMAEAISRTGAAWAGILSQNASGFRAGQGTGFGSFDPFSFYASMPGIGYSREKQEDLSKLYKLWAEYEHANQKYNAGMTGVSLMAVQKFQDYVAKPPAGAAPLTSLKEVYAKWVDICEDVYAKYAVTEEYVTLYGEVVNALMAYKKHFNKMTDDFIDQFNLPTRRELDSLHQRMQELRREVAAMKKAARPTGPAPKPAAAKPAPVAKKPAPKKPTAKKPAPKKKKR